MLFDLNTDEVRLTSVELNRIRKHAAKQGYSINTIMIAEELDDALFKACSTQELTKLLKGIQQQADRLSNKT